MASATDPGDKVSTAGAGYQPVGIVFALIYLLANAAVALQGSGLIYGRAAAEGAGGIANLLYITAAGTAGALVAYPLIGALSDRTAAPALRRRLYLLLGAALCAVAMLALLFAQTLAQFLLAWALLQIGGAAVQLMLLVALPDTTPTRQRGLLAALVAAGTTLGALGGSLLVDQALPTTRPASSTGTPSANLILVVAAFAASIVVAAVLMALALGRRGTTSTVAGSQVGPPRYGDFAWTAISRVYFAGAVAIVGTNAFQVYGAAVGYKLWLVSGPQTALIPVAALATGLLSDRVGRRKPLVFAGALMTAAGALVLIVMPLATSAQLPQPGRVALTILGGALLGAGSGTYLTTLLALATEVLPSPRHYARDLGWLQLGALLPAAVLPFASLYLLLASVAYPLVNYVGFVVFGALCAVLGGLAILLVRSAR